MANPNIYQQFLRPVRSVADYSNELDRGEANALNLAAGRREGAMQEQAMAQQVSERNALQRLAQGWTAQTKPEDRIASLRNSGHAGLSAMADAQEKQQLDRRKVESEATGKNVETENKVIGVYRDMIGMAQNPQAAAELVRVMHSDPRLKNTPMAGASVEQGIGMMGGDPQSFERWKQQFALGAAKYVEQNKPTLTTQNLGGTSRIVSTPGLGGPSSVASEAPITQSADNRASQETQRRGQNMTDSRARDANTQSKDQGRTVLDSDRGLLINTQTGLARPFVGLDGQPVGAKDKGLNDMQSKALLFGTRMQEADKILEKLSKAGTDQPGMLKRGVEATLGVIPQWAGGDGLAAAGGSALNWTQSDEQQQVEQAKRDFINAVLRRESGAAIGADEFVSADKQYFPAPGDSEAVKAQKAKNRKLATDGILAEVPQNKRGSITPKAAGSVMKFDASGNLVAQ